MAKSKSSENDITKKIDEIMADVKKSLAEVAKKHDLKELKFGGVTYDPNGGFFKTTLNVILPGGNSPEFEALKVNAWLLGLNPDIAGAKIQYAKKEFIVTGLRRTKITLEDELGGKYDAPIDSIVKALKSQGSPYVLPADENGNVKKPSKP